MGGVANGSMTGSERRASTRLYGSYPARVRGRDQAATRFESTTLVDNISAGGLFLQLNRPLWIGARLFVVVSVLGRTSVAALGTVVRTEPRAQGLNGVAVRFYRSRVLMTQGGQRSEATEGISEQGQ